MKNSVLLFLFLLSPFSVLAENITWYTLNRPPWFMENGNGYGDHMQASYMVLLPQFQHVSKKVNLARMFADMKKGRRLCISALAVLPAMRQYMYLSKTTYVLPRPKIFMKSKTYFKMGSPASLSIKELAANSNYRMGIIGGVKHLPVQPEDYRDSAHVSIISNTAPIISIMKMVSLGRIDWSADFPHMMQWGAGSGVTHIDDTFTMVNIAEYQGMGGLKAGIACSKSAWGQVIIDQLNILVDKEIILAHRELTSKWMPPGPVREEYFRLNKSEFGY